MVETEKMRLERLLDLRNLIERCNIAKLIDDKTKNDAYAKLNDEMHKELAATLKTIAGGE